jgi:hypothetical protein
MAKRTLLFRILLLEPAQRAPLRVVPILDDILRMFDELVLPASLEDVRLGCDFTLRVLSGHVRDGEGGNVEPGSLVHAEHRPGRCGGAFLDVT